MTARFAGSHDLGQRRRRRLAQDADSCRSAPDMGRSQRPLVVNPQSVPEKAAETGPRLPRETMIPGSWIRISALGVLGLAVWGTVIWLGISSWSRQMGISELVSLRDGPLPRFFSTATLLVTAQLSLLIYWHRSRSRKDFSGRYRIWGWAGLFWGIVCLANATSFHLPIVQSLNAQWPVNCWRGESVYWFGPLAVGILALYRLVGREMSPSRASTATWNLAFCLSLLVGGFQLGLELLLPETWQTPLPVGVMMLWQYTLALSCLVHARYVTHVTNEAGGKRPSLTTRIARSLTPRVHHLGESLLSIRLPVRRKNVDKPAERAARKERRPAPPKPRSKTDNSAPLQKPIIKPALSEEQKEKRETIPWTQKLKQRVLGRWTIRADSPTPDVAAVPKPHSKIAPASSRQKTPPVKPSAPTEVQSVSSKAATGPMNESQAIEAKQESGGLSSRERKRLKKLQRQQARA